MLGDSVEHANYYAGKSINWQDYLLRQGSTKTQVFHLSGGTDKFHYYMNGDAYMETGIVQHIDFDRYSFRMNADYEPYKFIKVGANTQATITSADVTGTTLSAQNAADFSSYLGNTPLGRDYDNDGNLVPTVKADQFQYNPLYQWAQSKADSAINRFYVSPYLEFKILDGLTFRVNASAERRR